MGAAKSQLGLWRRKRPRPAKWIKAPVGKLSDPLQAVPINDHPSSIVMFEFGLTGITLGFPETGKFDVKISLVPVVTDFWERVRRTRSQVFSNDGGASPQYFARMLAKIAHAYAVAEIGADKFTPLLLDQILGTRAPRIGHLFGSERFNKPATKELHELSWDKETLSDGRAFYVVKIRLFACYGAPTHRVVVGEVLEPSQVPPSG